MRSLMLVFSCIIRSAGKSEHVHLGLLQKCKNVMIVVSEKSLPHMRLNNLMLTTLLNRWVGCCLHNIRARTCHYLVSQTNTVGACVFTCYVASKMRRLIITCDCDVLHSLANVSIKHVESPVELFIALRCSMAAVITRHTLLSI